VKARALPLAGLALLALALPARATTIGETSFGKLASGAQVIVVGKVARVVEVPAGDDGTVRVAEVSVSDWIKGDPRPPRIWMLAEPKYDADDSTAVAGEEALLFLTDPLALDSATEEEVRARLEAPAFRKNLAELTGGAPLLHIGWAGRGRMPLDDVAGVRYATLDAWHVHLPPEVGTLPGPDPRFSDYVRRAPLADLVARARRRQACAVPPAVRGLFDAVDAGAESEADEEILPALLALLHDPGFARRDTAAEACAWLDATDALAAELQAKDPGRRRGAAWALAWIASLGLGSPDASPGKVRAAVRDPDPEVRAAAVEMVGALGALGALDGDRFAPVLAALADERAVVRRGAVRTLLRMRIQLAFVEEDDAGAAEAALLPLVATEDAALRREAWEVLAHVAGPATLAAARAARIDADPVVCVLGIRALGRIPAAQELLPPLLESHHPWTRRAAAHALGLGKAAAGVPALVKALDDPDAGVVANAVDALGEIGPPAAAAAPALERLRAAGSHEDAVQEALEKIRG